MARFVDRRSFSTLGFSPAQLGRDLLMGILIGSLWLGLSLGVLWLFGWAIPESSGVLDGPVLAVAGLALVLNTVIQEVLARSYTFQTIRSQTSPAWAILLSAVIFMLYHAAGFRGAWLPAVNVFLAGVLFGVAVYRTGNLWLPISIHFAWNFLLGPVLGLAVSGQDIANHWQLFSLQGPVLFSGGAFGIEGGLIVTLITLLGTAALWLWYPRHSHPVAIHQMKALSTP
jgi:membrane protease YdiL (CAAX protease family)